MSKFRLFFTTDIHGSDVCFRKFLNAAKVYEASVLVLGGDITGKLLIPLVDQGQGRFRYHWLDRDVVTDSEGIAAAEREIRAAAAYSFRTDPEQLARIQADPDAGFGGLRGGHGGSRQAVGGAGRGAAPRP